MDFSILFTVLGVSILGIGYGLLVFKLANLVDDNISQYLGFFVWMMGLVGIPLAVLLSIIH